MLHIGFLASHFGSTMQSVIDACEEGRILAKPTVLISNNRSSQALQRAKKSGFPGFCLNSESHPDPNNLDRVILETLHSFEVDLVVLAGYLKQVGPITIKNLFEETGFLIIFWTHFVSINLFCGSWIVRDSQKYMMPRFLIFLPLLMTYFIGPIGIFLYWFIRIFFAKKITLFY